jgi:sulfonate transport system permease protein
MSAVLQVQLVGAQSRVAGPNSNALLKRSGRHFAPWLAPLTLLVLWQGLSQAGVIEQRLLPAPAQVFEAAWAGAVSGELWLHLGVSSLRAAAGVAIGASLGLLLGTLTGLSRTLQLIFDGPMQMLRAVPALALVPLVILWFGLGESGKIFIVVISSVFPVYLNTFHGIRSVDPQLIEMAQIYGLGRLQLYRDVILPGALPSVLVGLRLALGFAWLVMIVAESLGATSGLGYIAQNAREFMQLDLLVLTIVLWALLGKAADVLARALERRLLPWLPKQQRLEAV